MLSKDVTINNEIGLYARPATLFIQKANAFSSTILIESEERRVNAKSLLGVLSLAVEKGRTITIIADGPDEEKALKALVDFVESDFQPTEAGK